LLMVSGFGLHVVAFEVIVELEVVVEVEVVVELFGCVELQIGRALGRLCLI